MKKLITPFLSVACLLAFAGVAFAATVGLPSPEGDPLGYLAQIYGFAHDGRIALAIVLGLMGVVWALRSYKPAWFGGDVRGAALAMAAALIEALGLALYNGATLSAGLVKAALLSAVLAMGGWSGVWKRLLQPALAWVASAWKQARASRAQ